MKKWILISLLFVASQCFGTAALVQRTDADTIGNPLTLNFTSNTTSGSLLILTASATIVGTGTHPAPVISAPSTSGFTWVLGATSNQVVGSPETAETVVLYFISRAPPMSSSTSTSISATITGAGSSAFGVQLTEWSGVQIVDVLATASGVSPTNATAGNLVTTADGLILCFVTDPNYDTSFGAGSGYTLVSTGGVGTAYGKIQYQATGSGGTYSTAYAAGISGAWTMVAVAFKPSVAAARHGGGVF